MASVKYLWLNRVKLKPSTFLFYKVWGKRIFTFPEVVRRNYRRYRLTSRMAKIHQSAEVGNVNIAGAVNLLSIGSETFLGRVNISIHDIVEVGNRVCINDGVEILTASHDVNDSHWKEIKAAVIIEDYAWIGTGAMILPGVTIGRGAVVGARAVVAKSVEAGQIVVGNPAKVLSHKRSDKLDYNPCEFLAANRSWLIG